VVPFVGKFITLQASEWEKAVLSCEQNCAGIRREISLQNMLPHDSTKDAGFVSFNPETSAPIPGVRLVMNSVLSPEGKRMAKTTI
jgi:hypothetical protein